MAELAALSLSQGLMIGGSLLSAVGTVQSANAQNAAAQYQAEQLEATATAERAAASIEAKKARNEKLFIQSRARAVGAASGGGQDIELLGRIEEEGTERELMALWGGEERAKGREGQADAARFEGKQAQRAGYIGAATSLLSSGTSFFEEYG